ncbi:hypothetical protein OSB04_009866 [Centaurea solstitialis]|uniref:Uncharacterized protein n=1 Tax=Centaurea solstitialis TaxID=347529 RepID=A0AA38TPH1_9ASTR|nr:hypothetical protein OSB04_009866 [Centaurea solstitialis]
MNREEQVRTLFGISLTDKPIWQQFSFALQDFSLGILLMAFVRNMYITGFNSATDVYFNIHYKALLLLDALYAYQGFTPKQMVNPWNMYVKLSAVLMGSHGLTKGSLAYLNYPAQLMFKSTKVLPVMIMGAFIPGLRRKYPPREYLSAILLVVGLILFT